MCMCEEYTDSGCMWLGKNFPSVPAITGLNRGKVAAGTCCLVPGVYTGQGSAHRDRYTADVFKYDVNQ